jgi:hypothetical protein
MHASLGSDTDIGTFKTLEEVRELLESNKALFQTSP